MKVTIDHKALAAALKVVVPAVARGSSLAVLSGVHLAAADGRLTLTCSNLELTVSTVVAADCTTGAAIVPALTFARIVGGLGGESVTLVADDGEMRVEADSAVARMRLLPLDEWPRFPVVDGEPVEFTAEQVELIRKVSLAASIDQKRQILCSVRFTGREVMATDSYRLHVADLGDVDFPDVKVPAWVMRSVLANVDNALTVAFSHAYASFTADDATWSTRLIDGEYPRTQPLIRSDSPHHLTVDSERFAEAVQRAAIVGTDAPDGGVAVICDLTSGRLTASSNRPDVGQVDDDLACESTWIGKIGVNAKFMAELMEAHGPGEASIDFVDHMKPLLARRQSLTLLLMPTNPGGICGEGK